MDGGGGMYGCVELRKAVTMEKLGGGNVKTAHKAFVNGTLVAITRLNNRREYSTFFLHSIYAMQQFAYTNRTYQLVGVCLEDYVYATRLEVTWSLREENVKNFMRSMANPWPSQVHLALQLFDAMTYLNDNHLVFCDGGSKNYAIRTDGSWMFSDVDDLATVGSKAGKWVAGEAEPPRALFSTGLFKA